MAEMGLEARRTAVRAMSLVTGERRLLSDVLPELTAPLSSADAARTARLATEALRWANRSDRVLGPFLRLRPEEPVMNALRLAVWEIFEERTPPHAAVDAAVTLAAGPKAGLVNGVLRNALRRGAEWTALPVPQVPKWLRKRLVAAWGKEATAAMERVFAQRPPIDLTARVSGWAERLGANVLPGGSMRLPPGMQVSVLPGFAEGAWWVQDAGAAVPARVLAARPGERVLDLCAAPGGKTMQLAADGAEVTALDISEARLVRLRDNLARTCLSAQVVVADALEWEPDEPFDAILLDAPCSATGTLRRHPDLAYARDGSGIAELTRLQARLLDRAAGWLKPGGRLVYATCSLLPEEGEEIVAAAGRTALTLTVPEAEGLDPRWRTQTGLRLRPDHWADWGGIDGFFVARLEKRP
jgi:16S rRNA (cytosine967-C5)-methyltransferase